MAPLRGDRDVRGRPAGALLAGGLVVLAAIAVLAYALGAVGLAPAATPQTAPAGPELAERSSNLSPQHLTDLPPTERYFNAVTPRQAGGAGERTVGIRPDLDDRRMGYVVYSLGGQYHSLSTLAKIAANAPDGTRMRVEVWGDGRLLFAGAVATGADRPILNLDVTGIDQLKLCALSAGPPAGDPYTSQAAFLDPVVS